MASTAVVFCPCCRQRPILTTKLVPGSSSLRALDFFVKQVKKVLFLCVGRFLFCGIKTRFGGCLLFLQRNKMGYGCVSIDCFVLVPGILLALITTDSLSFSIEHNSTDPNPSYMLCWERKSPIGRERSGALRRHISTDQTRGADLHCIPGRRDMCSLNCPNESTAFSADNGA